MPRSISRRVLGYARVSSREQAIGSSLQDQQDAIAAYASSLGLTVTKMYVEAESAVREKIERRVQMQALLVDARAGDLVLAHRLDRWSRDPEFTYRTVRELLAKDVGVYFIDDRCDPSTSEGDTALGFRILFAREEHKRIKERMVGTRRLLKDRGYYADGLVPLGYRRTGGKGIAKNILVLDDAGAERVRRAFRMAAQGRSLAEISSAISVEKSLVHDLLRSRTFLGEVRDSHGHWIKGHHAPIVDAHTFAAAGEGMSSRRHGWNKPPNAKVATATWWLRDIARCLRCGAKMGASYRPLVSGAVNYAFFCFKRCGAQSVRLQDAEAACDPMVTARLTALGAELTRKTSSTVAAPETDFATKRAALAKKRDRFLEAFADGHFDRAELRARMAKLDVERTKLEALAAGPATISPSARKAVLETVTQIAGAWSNTPAVERRQLVRELAKTVCLERGQEPRFDWRTVAELTEGLAQ